MDLRTWITDSLSGVVISRVHMTPGSLFGLVIGGGSMSGEVVLSSLRSLDGSPSPAALQSMLGTLEEGRHSILLTAGTEVVGEWLLFGHVRDHDAATVPVSGIEWDAYPQYRSIHTPLTYSNTDVGVVHSDALDAAINDFQHNGRRPVVVPVPSFGHAVTEEFGARTGYYSDLIKYVDDLGLAEWRVRVSATWDGDVPVQVTRTVDYQFPVLSSAHPDPLVKVSAGDRGGNLTKFSRSYDLSRIAHGIGGWGAGKGEKKRYSLKHSLTYPTHLAITRNIHFRGEYSNVELAMKTQAAVNASQNPWEPTRATVDMRRMSTPPVIGGTHDVTVAQALAYPEGDSWRMRVGELQFRYGAPLVDVEMEEVA